MGIAALIMGLISAAVGIGMTVYQNRQNQEINHQQQQFSIEQMDRAHHLNEQSAENADTRTRDLFSDLQSPTAKVNQLKNAGLSIGMMYGNGGNGGSIPTGSQAGGVNGTTPNAFPNIFDISSLQHTQQAALNAAQIENVKADTAQKKQGLSNMQKQETLLVTQNDKLKEDIEKVKIEQQELLQRVENEQTQNAILKLQETTQSLENQITTIDLGTRFAENISRIEEAGARIKNLIANAEQSGAQKDLINQQTEYLEKTMDLRITEQLYKTIDAKLQATEITPWQAIKLRKEVVLIGEKARTELWNQAKIESEINKTIHDIDIDDEKIALQMSAEARNWVEEFVTVGGLFKKKK